VTELDNFIFKEEYLVAVDHLAPARQAQFSYAILRLAFYGEEPEFKDRALLAAWKALCIPSLPESVARQELGVARREAGRSGGNARVENAKAACANAQVAQETPSNGQASAQAKPASLARAQAPARAALSDFQIFTPPKSPSSKRQATGQATGQANPPGDPSQTNDPAAQGAQETDGYLRFFSAYPKQRHRAEAAAAWAELAPDEALQETIMEALALQKTSELWHRMDGKFVPLPDNWLRKRRWEDSLPELERIRAETVRKTYRDWLNGIGAFACSAAERERRQSDPEHQAAFRRGHGIPDPPPPDGDKGG